MERRKPLRIEVPREDRPRFGRVGVIALIGFAVGVSWPHLAGVRIVPRAPTPASEAANDELSGAPAPSAEPATSKAEAQPAEPPPPAAAPTPLRFTIGEGEVTSCRDAHGKRVSSCDKVDFDVVARGRLATLAACDASSRARGVLSVGFDLDFERDRVAGIQKGKSTTVSDADARTLIGCLNETLGEVSLASIAHANARYTVFYRVEFRDPVEPAPEAAANGAAPAVTPASGRATVAWDVALVRAGASREDDVVARVLQGTRVTVTGRKGDWYRVKYDGKGSEGWVFRTALGM
jgi:Bacterial SH3 domain